MQKDKKLPANAKALRQAAEERLLARNIPPGPPLTKGDLQRLVHELQVHQVELEMQNEELLQVRTELETSLAMCTELYDFAPVAYFTLDRDGVIRKVNLTGASLLGIERSRLIGRRFGPLVAVEARPAFTAFLGKVFESRDKKECELALLKEGNIPLIVQVEAAATASGLDCGIALIDITERRRVEEALKKEKGAAEALRQAKEAAEAIARTKSQFLANMSHELRTPMTGVLGMLDLALLGNLEAEQREFIETARTSARSLVRILNDILDMTKIEMGKLSMEDKPFSLRECLENTIKILLPVAKGKGLDLDFTVADNVPDTLVGDQIRISQVVTNLAGNAVKFTEKGKVEIRVTAGGSAPGGKREVTFTVTDTGIGIPSDKGELIFQSFTQADESHARSYGGAGLGLAISRELVERMGGMISFTSEEGKGSVFSCTVPLGEAETDINATFAFGEPAAPEAPPHAEEKKRPRLLVAEDDAVTRKFLGTMFQRSNYEIDFTDNGQSVVEIWKNGEYDLILMDVQMPRMNGFEATTAIREKERSLGGHTPIVAMTAHALKEDEERCLNAGMDAYVSKPIDFKACLQVIGETLKKTGVVR